MNSQQLQEARQTLWHQDGRALTTLDDAQTWLNTVGICLWLPRGSQFAAPMPSFVEACDGVASATPSHEAILHATELLARLSESGAAIPLNLLGTNIGVEGERADFVVASSALSYVYALRGARPWKTAPPTGGAGRVSTLSLRVWEALQTHETMELSELRELVAHDVSDAGVLRALAELWASLRAFPIPQIGGKPARWQLLSRRFSKQLNAGSSMGQAAALSALISLYLDSVIAASTEEIEAALSPLVARSRVGEVVRALEQNRQIDFTAVGGALLMHFSDVEAHLPPPTEIVLPPTMSETPEAASTGPKKYTPRPTRPEPTSRTARGGEAPRTFPSRERRATGGSESSRPSYPRRAASSPTDRSPRRSFGDRSQFKPSTERGGSEKRGPYGINRTGPAGQPREGAPLKSRSAGGPAGKSFGGPRSGTSGPPRERASFKPRGASSEEQRRGSGGPRSGGPRSAPPREGAPFKPRSAGGPPRKPFGGARTGSGGPPRERTAFRPRPADTGGEQRRSFSGSRSAPPREGASFKPRGGDRPQRRSFAAPGSGPTGPPRERSSFADRGNRPSTGAPKRFGSAPPFREGGERKPFSPTSRPRSEGGKSFGPRKSFGTVPSGFNRPSGKFGGKPSGSFGGKRPPRAESSEHQVRETSERRPWQNRPTGSGASGKSSAPRPTGERPRSKSSFSKPLSDRPRSSTPGGETSRTNPGGFGKRPGGGFKKDSSRGSGSRKPGGFSKGSGGPKRSGGGFSKRPGGLGKRPGGPGRGKPRT